MTRTGAPNWFDAGGGAYAQFRPQYPDALIAYLADLATSRSRVVDVGCGTGQLTVRLADYFDEVVGVDPSASQIANATPRDRVRYGCAGAEQVPLPDHSVDLVTVAQAAHWFDLAPFYAEVRRVGRTAAAIALISYGVLRLDDTALNERFARFYADEIGAFWPPERRHVDAGYVDLAFPFTPIAAPELVIEKSWRREEFLGYISTWSATRRAVEAGEGAVLDRFSSELNALWPLDDPVTITWPVTVRAGRL